MGNDLDSTENLTTKTGVQVPGHPESQIHHIHPLEQVIGDPGSTVMTRGQLRSANSPENLGALAFYSKIQKSGYQNDWSFACYVLQVEPRTYKDALLDTYRFTSGKEENWNRKGFQV